MSDQFPSEWRHCTPLLLTFISCAATPWRVCSINGSHDHLVDTGWSAQHPEEH